ncbi:YceI family protein [Arthrobacter sp. S1_S22]|nr:YceI family protein [Arthrobacter sp. S1_S22]
MTAEPALQIHKLPEAGEYRIDPERSGVTYASRHMFGLGRVRAEFRVSSGLLNVASTLAGSSASAIIDSASFDSANERRDRDVKGRGLLDVAGFPIIAFSSTGIREDGGAILLAGIVAMHGVEAAAEVTVLSWDALAPGQIRLTAQANHLDRYSFGITGAGGFVGRYFDLAFQIVAVRSET